MSRFEYLEKSLPAVLEGCRTLLMGEGHDYRAMRNGVQCVTQSSPTKRLFLCFQITMEVKSDPGNQSRFPEINPRAARTLSMKRNWPFAFWSHRIPTNAMSSSALAGSPPRPRTLTPIHKQYRGCCWELWGGGSTRSQASPPPAPQKTGCLPPRFSSGGFPSLQAFKTMTEPLKGLSSPPCGPVCRRWALYLTELWCSQSELRAFRRNAQLWNKGQKVSGHGQ